jgi:hypothetical protein
VPNPSKRVRSLIIDTSFFLPLPENNRLSFIETSALDSTNVETAFQNILTGKRGFGFLDLTLLPLNIILSLES